MSYQRMNGAPGQGQRPSVPQPAQRRSAKARMRRAQLTIGTVIALVLGMVGYGIYRHLGPDPGCANVRDAAAHEPTISADQSAQHYDDLYTEVDLVRSSLATGEQKAFFPFDGQVGTAKSDANSYEKDVYRILTPNKLHLYKVTPDMLATDQKRLFADLSGLRSHCGA